MTQAKPALLSRLANKLARIKNGPATALCTRASSSVLSSEASLENYFGKAECIAIGENSYIRGRLLTYGHGGHISIGDWCYVGLRSEIWSMNSIKIGDRVLIAHDVNIHDGSAHSLNAQERHEHTRHIITKGHPTDVKQLPGIKSSPIVIGDDVWISFGVTILQGVNIGAGSVIAAGAMVTEDVPPGVLYRCQVFPQITKLSA